ncbi:MAG: type II toxin-antitoxin system RelE/ParE family toxin [Thermodesulfovibrionales bacterium]|nr:type II toxin-antitoxin system RelE/ParE family toxin [Thermodesulfovibrionales bacterium]
MDKFHIVLSPYAVKDLDGFSDIVCTRIANSMKALEENPFPRGKQVRKIKGKRSDYYRLRADKYRVFYMIEGKKIVILKILTKKDAERFINNLN